MNVFIDEVRTQGTVLSGCFEYYFGAGRAALESVVTEFKTKKFGRILFVGMGSSFYAPHCVTDYLSGKGIPATVLSGFDASRFNYAQISSDTLVVCISQSGKSWEVVELAKKAREKTTVVGIFNREDSLLSEAVAHRLPILAGEERLISNKSYLCTQAVLNLFAHALTGELDGTFRQECLETAEWITEWLADYKEKTQPMFDFSKSSTIYDFFADGPSLSTARQAGLIYREGPKVYSGANEAADYAHGWNKCAKAGYCGLLLSPAFEGEAEKRMVDFVIAEGGKMILLTAAEPAAKNGLYVQKLHKVRSSLMPLLEIIPLNTLMGLMLGEGWTR
jgi:fructoselysine-6-P-deglycase FrlB-like protein